LDYHPHVHVVMPAATIDADKQRWRTKRNKKGQSKNQTGYLFNHKALAKVFRAKLLDAITQERLELPVRYPETWVVAVKSVSSGDKALVYLGRYLYKGVIQEKDIIACRDGLVTFRYQDSKTKKMQTRTLPGAQFLWLILQHVLPKGFRRTRNFGFLHSNSKRVLALLQWLLRLNPVKTLIGLAKRPPIQCPCCGGAMRIVQTRMPPPLAFGLPALSG
jgi:Putative transposase